MRLPYEIGLLLLLGCAARRELTLRSEPSGAQVRIDDLRVGTTPCKVDFGAYGVRQVTFHLEGYRALTERIELSAPWYARFPIDVFSEVLLPLGWKDKRELYVVLEPGGEELHRPDLRSVLDRAEVLRRAGPDGPRELPAPAVREAPPAPVAEKPSIPDGAQR